MLNPFERDPVYQETLRQRAVLAIESLDLDLLARMIPDLILLYQKEVESHWMQAMLAAYQKLPATEAGHHRDIAKLAELLSTLEHLKRYLTLRIGLANEARENHITL